MSEKFPKTNLWDNKKSPAFKEWIERNIKMDPSEWNSEFKTYVKIKDKERNVVLDSPEKSIEQERKDVFDRYVEMLNLSENDLRDKKILDLGCDEGKFVIECIDKGLTDESYGVDIELRGDASDPKYQEIFSVSDFNNDLSFENLDLVISLAALNLNVTEENKDVIKNRFKKAISLIKDNGQVRIGPVWKGIRGDIAGIIESEKVILEILNELEKELDISWELISTDINFSANRESAWLNQVLIIEKK